VNPDDPYAHLLPDTASRGDDPYAALRPKADTSQDDPYVSLRPAAPINTDSLSKAEGTPMVHEADGSVHQPGQPDLLGPNWGKDLPVETDRLAASDADTKARLGQLIPSLSGLVHGVVDPFVTLAKAGAHQLAPNSTWLQEHFPNPTGAEIATAAPQALVGAIAPGALREVEGIASPLARAATRTALTSGMGAVYDPSNPLRGAAIGLAAGGAHSAIADVPQMLPTRASLAARINPQMAADAAMVPGLTEQRDLMERHANTDDLTQLANRRAYNQAIPSAEADPATKVVRFDLHNFKAVNTVAGHAGGDQVLRSAASAIGQAADEHGASGRVFRVGGDEFAALVPADKAESFRSRAEDLFGVQEPEPGIKTAISGGIGDTDHAADQAAEVQKGIDKGRHGLPLTRAESDAQAEAVLAKRRSNPQITADEGESGNFAARDQEQATPVAGSALDAVPSRGVATSATTEHSAVVPDETVQPSLHDQAVQSSGGPAAVGAVDGAGAPQGLEYRNAGLSLPRKAWNAIKGALDRPYAQLESTARDLTLRNSLRAGGTGRAFGGFIADRGMATVRAGIDPEMVRGIEARVMADNAEMQAQSRDAAGAPEEAANWRAHQAEFEKLAPAGIENTPEYAQWLDSYRQRVENHLNDVFYKTGGTAETARGVKPNSAFVPLAPEMGAEPPSVIQMVRSGNKTSLSSAVKTATGGAAKYSPDVQQAVARFLPERMSKAANNDVMQAIRDYGREVGGRREVLNDGEKLIALDDKYQLTTGPDDSRSSHFIAVPEHAADAIAQYAHRTGPQGPPGLLTKLARKMVGATTIGSPAIGLTHGGSIASTVNLTPGSGALEAGRLVANATPFGNTLAGIADLNTVNLTDAATHDRMAEIARYGGFRPSETVDPKAGLLKRIAGKVGGDLFGQNGMDPRGRALVAQRLMESDPSLTPADVAQKLDQQFGAYISANQPDFVYRGQKSNLTSFAPAGFAFTGTALKRATGAAGPAQFAKLAGGAAAGTIGYNYLMSGHGPWDNEKGHKLDIDLGEKNDKDQEQYLKKSYGFPLAGRAANTLGLNALANGQGLSGAAAGAADETMSQVGVLPRSAFAAANAQLRMKPGYNGLETAVDPQAGEGNRFLKIAQGAASPMLGAAGGIGGFSSFDADQSLKDRLLNAVHANAVGSGRKPNTPQPNALYQGLDDKVYSATLDIQKAETPAAKAEAMAQAMARFRDDGHSGIELMAIQQKLLRASLTTETVKGLSQQNAMRKKGFAPETQK
jgi:diguanylate cyclase (GGDEF)-like protein